MAVAGIIAEYNPFHRGHAWQIQEVRRRLGADTAVVACMSGNFVQRGDFAILAKHPRAEAALAGGVDLVVTHSPAQGLGDDTDYAHRGFACLVKLLDRYKPRYLVHGHVHVNYGHDRPRILHRGETTIINAYERYMLELPD